MYKIYEINQILIIIINYSGKKSLGPKKKKKVRYPMHNTLLLTFWKRRCFPIKTHTNSIGSYWLKMMKIVLLTSLFFVFIFVCEKAKNVNYNNSTTSVTGRLQLHPTNSNIKIMNISNWSPSNTRNTVNKNHMKIQVCMKINEWHRYFSLFVLSCFFLDVWCNRVHRESYAKKVYNIGKCECEWI
jgi:hypothetical protein